MNFFLGIDIGGTNIKAALVSQKGRILHEIACKTEAQAGPKRVKENITRSARDIFLWAARHDKRVAAAGVGCAGIVDDKGNVFIPPNLPKWKKENLSMVIKKAIHVPVFVENDANAAALAEKMFGSARKYNDFILYTMGTGIGGSIIINGNAFKGTAFAAAELGHVVLFPNGKKCKCGARGCLERYIGRDGIVERARQKMRKGKGKILRELLLNGTIKLTPRLINEAARKGDKTAIETLSETGHFLGIAAATIFTIFNMPAIILAGGISQASKFILPAMRKSLKENARLSPFLKPVILKASAGKGAGVLGAAALAMREYSKSSRGSK